MRIVYRSLFAVSIALAGNPVLAQDPAPPAPPPGTAPNAERKTEAAPAPTVDVSPETRRQLRSLFEPLRKAVEGLHDAAAAARKSADGGDMKQMDKAMKAGDKASAALEKKKAEVFPKALAIGVSDDQLQSEWQAWVKEVKDARPKQE